MCVSIGSQFDGWFGADKVDFGIFVSEVGDTPSGSSVASDDNDSGAPAFEGFDIFGDDCLKLQVRFFAIWAIFGVGDIFIFFVRKDIFNGI